jgi:hypothetical protein
VFKDRLQDKTGKGRDTWVGTFLSGKTDREVAVTVGNSTGTAVLRRNPVRNDQKRYYFEVTWATPGVGTTPAESPAAPLAAAVTGNDLDWV